MTTATCEPCLHRRSTARVRQPRAVPRVGDTEGPRDQAGEAGILVSRVRRKGGASQGRTAREQTWGLPADGHRRHRALRRHPRAGLPDGSNWGQLLPSVRSWNARRHVWRRRTKSGAGKMGGCEAAKCPLVATTVAGGVRDMAPCSGRGVGRMETPSKPQHRLSTGQAQHSTSSAQDRLSTGRLSTAPVQQQAILSVIVCELMRMAACAQHKVVVAIGGGLNAYTTKQTNSPTRHKKRKTALHVKNPV